MDDERSWWGGKKRAKTGAEEVMLPFENQSLEFENYPAEDS